MTSTDELFQRWHDDLTAKLRAELAPRERSWVEDVYEKHDVVPPARAPFFPVGAASGILRA